jgi:putative ABC transport system permease protein
MNFMALRMLAGDRAKYFSLILANAFASFLLANQMSIFIGIMTRPISQILDVVDADIWMMDPQTLLLYWAAAVPFAWRVMLTLEDDCPHVS